MRQLLAALSAILIVALCASHSSAQSKAPTQGQQTKPVKVIAGGTAAVPTDSSSSSSSSPLAPLSRWLPLGDGGSGTGEGTAASRLIQTAAVLTLLSIAPALLIMATSFTRFLIAFSFLRSGLGLQGAPANIVLITLALFMTLYVMAPTFDTAWEGGAKPLLENRISEQEGLKRIVEPFERFMRANVREKELKVFQDIAARKATANRGSVEAGERSLRTLVPAFIISELRRGFEIGFLILLPFLVIDLLVATFVMSMGMMMLSPTVFSLPCKVLFFVLIDGWSLIVHGLVRSFV
ncbi:MAG: flagellar type III secretion system pore protein FliP [Proteobacteria bacterium]|nr:flagellar type III secretion system pore protein FliP [Pseudomonadota bacterium]